VTRLERLLQGLPVRWVVKGPLPVSDDFALRTAIAVTAAAVAGRLKAPVPSLYASRVSYQLDPGPGCNQAVPWYVTAARGSGDCQDLTAWRLAELAHGDVFPVAQLEPGGRNSGGGRFLHVRLRDEDPSLELYRRGRALVERRAPGPECTGVWPEDEAGLVVIDELLKLANNVFGVVRTAAENPRQDSTPATTSKAPSSTSGTGRRNVLQELLQVDGRREPELAVLAELVRSLGGMGQGVRATMDEAGELDGRRDPEALHPLLQETLRRARANRLPVFLHSGRRGTWYQLGLWNRRMAQGRAAGDVGVPPDWRAVETDWARYAAWVLREVAGDNGRDPIALPGISKHQAGTAMDLGVENATRGTPLYTSTLARVAALAPAGVSRAIRAEPWHFEVSTDLLRSPA